MATADLPRHGELEALEPTRTKERQPVNPIKTTAGAPILPKATEFGHILPFPVPDPRKRRALLKAAVEQMAQSQAEFGRCLTKGETEEWARRLERVAVELDAVNGVPLGAKIAAAVADEVAKQYSRYSHTSEAQSFRALNREAERREGQRPRDERWWRDHDERGMSWSALAAREKAEARKADRKPFSESTIRRAVYRLRARILAENAAGHTVRCQGGNAPPDSTHCSKCSGSATIPGLEYLRRLRTEDMQGNMLFKDSRLLERLRDGVLHCDRMIEEGRSGRRAILNVLKEMERDYPSSWQAVFDFDDDDQGEFGF